MNNVKHHPLVLTSETSKTLVLSTSSFSMHQFTEMFTESTVVKIMKHVRGSMQGNLEVIVKTKAKSQMIQD